VIIVLPAEHGGQLLLGEGALQLPQRALELGRLTLGALLLGQLGEDERVLRPPEEGLEGLDLAAAAGDVGVEPLRGRRIVPYVGPAGLLLELAQLGLAGGEVKDDPSVPAPY